MKALGILKFGSSAVLKWLEIPIPSVNADEVLVKVTYTALNPKDLMIRKGKMSLFTGKTFPLFLGEDVAGVVEQVGNNTDFKVGDRVFGMVNSWKRKTMSTYAILKNDELALVPEGLPFENMAGIPLAGQTALQALRDLGKVQQGTTVCINGASGGVGTLAIQIAKTLGATVTAICSFRNIALCQSLGADYVIDYTKSDILNTSTKFDVFFDVFGNLSFKKVKPHLTKKGRYISTIPKIRIVLLHLTTFFTQKKAKLVVVKSNKKDLNSLSNLLVNSHLKPVTDTIFDKKSIREAHDYLETKRAKGKVLIRF